VGLFFLQTSPPKELDLTIFKQKTVKIFQSSQHNGLKSMQHGVTKTSNRNFKVFQGTKLGLKYGKKSSLFRTRLGGGVLEQKYISGMLYCDPNSF
jgi:hypothetical protein